MMPISPPVQAVLDLFASELADVRFGDLDAQTLTRLGADVSTAAAVVASAQATLDDARSTLHERQEVLLQHAQRALAFARVYAETNDALGARLDAISLPRANRRTRADATNEGGALVLTAEPQPAMRPRGRPRKAAAPEAMLEGIDGTAE